MRVTAKLELVNTRAVVLQWTSKVTAQIRILQVLLYHIYIYIIFLTSPPHEQHGRQVNAIDDMYAIREHMKRCTTYVSGFKNSVDPDTTLNYVPSCEKLHGFYI